MAQKVTTQLIDDLTGDVIAEGGGSTITFAFDGATYEIDLTNDNIGTLRKAFSDYVAAGRKVGVRATSGRKNTAARTDPKELTKIREWASANGYNVSSRGRISGEVRIAYIAAH